MAILYFVAILFILFSALFLIRGKASAHCDTMDGPTASDGKKALRTGNINYAYKWIPMSFEHELLEVFELSRKVRDFGPDAQQLAERFFLENLIRIHRAGEGAPFEGLKPSGVPIDEKVAAADKSIEIGNLSPLERLISHEELHALEEKFQRVIALKDYDINDIAAARNYVEAYVSFFKQAEGHDHDLHHSHGQLHAS